MKTAIIGGGIGGMMTALLLANEDFDVTIYEKEAKLGGRLTFVERDGYRIDQGPTIVLLPNMIRDILIAAGLSEDLITLIQCDPLYKIDYADGTSYVKYADITKQEEEIAKRFPESLDGFRQFIRDMDQRFAIGKPMFLEQPFLEQRDFWNRKTISTLIKLKAYKSVERQLRHYFKDEKLVTAYALQTLYVGGNPLTTPAIYSLVSYSEHRHGIYYVKGGYASLVERLELELRKRKVKIHLQHQVEKVVTNGVKAEKVLINGREEYFDQFILNGDFPIAERQLLNRGKSYTASSGCLLLYFGLDGLYDDVLPHQFYIGEDFGKTMNEIFAKKQLPTDPSYYTFNPSVIDETLAPSGKSVLYVLIPVPSGTKFDTEEQQLFIEKIITHMEKHAFPRLRERVEWVEVRTPEDAKKEGLFDGGSFGIAPSLFQSGIFRPQLKPYKEDNIYAVGASIHPGGGIPIVMQGAKMLSDVLISNRKQLSQGKEVNVVG